MRAISGLLGRRKVVAALAACFLVRYAPQAAFAAPQAFMVFFDPQSAELLPLAEAILIVIKPLIKPNTSTTIVGHADTSEKDPDKLSLARAKAVMMAFVDMTIPMNSNLSVSGKGTSEPHTPTGPNVPEATNRYVSITIE